MARIRYSLAEASAEAARLATEFVAGRSDAAEWKIRFISPNTLVPPSQASKHPVAWVVTFAPLPPEGSVIDGGELFVCVDLESGAVALCGY